MSLFSAVEMAPRDPILGLNEAFNADTRPTKVNLGVGVYTNEEGKIPLLRAVREAEKVRVEAGLPRGYLPIDGIAAYDQTLMAHWQSTGRADGLPWSANTAAAFERGCARKTAAVALAQGFAFNK